MDPVATPTKREAMMALIREEWERRGWTQNRFATETGVEASSVTNLAALRRTDECKAKRRRRNVHAAK